MADAYRTFGSYILFREVVADDLGHLYRAGELGAGGVQRMVWLRVFDSPHIPTREMRARFDAGNRIGDILQAANIAANPSFFEHAGASGLAWDYVSAQPLSRVFAKVSEESFPVPVDNALLILEKLSVALAAALAVDVAGASLVHGFLHPSMVVVSNDGEGLVTGFGVADALLTLLDHPQAAAAIQPYLAPEIIMTRTASQRGDVYSLGAILYHLLTAEPIPQQPEARSDVLEGAQLAYDEKALPDDIKSLLTRALATRPEERFGSAADFKTELDKLLYGGAYSPTTFNLALFMDRLFRSEIEAEERQRAEEQNVDVTPYLEPVPAPVPEEVVAQPPPPSRSHAMGLWVGVGAAMVIVAAVVVALLVGRTPPGPVAPPTPTAADVAARKQAEQDQIKAMVDQELQRMMAEKEDEISSELMDRQGKIDELQKRLRDLERKRETDSASAAEAQRDRLALQRQLAAEEEAKRQQELELEQERQQALAAARNNAAASADQTETAGATPQQDQGPILTHVTPVPTAPSPGPTRTPRVEPPRAPNPTAVVVTENIFVDPSQVDTQPAVLREQAVVWPRNALYSRRKGVIIIRATVNAEGRVEDVKVLRADHEGFGIPQAALSAVRKYLFRPATKTGTRVKTYATVAIPYRFQTR
jgi:TonB family protein